MVLTLRLARGLLSLVVRLGGSRAHTSNKALVYMLRYTMGYEVGKYFYSLPSKQDLRTVLFSLLPPTPLLWLGPPSVQLGFVLRTRRCRYELLDTLRITVV